jgi:hypothetical protein
MEVYRRRRRGAAALKKKGWRPNGSQGDRVRCEIGSCSAVAESHSVLWAFLELDVSTMATSGDGLKVSAPGSGRTAALCRRTRPSSAETILRTMQI